MQSLCTWYKDHRLHNIRHILISSSILEIALLEILEGINCHSSESLPPTDLVGKGKSTFQSNLATRGKSRHFFMYLKQWKFLVYHRSVFGGMNWFTGKRTQKILSCKCCDSEGRLSQVSRLYIPMWHYLAVWAVLGSVCKCFAFNKVFMKESFFVCFCFFKQQLAIVF